MWGGIYAVLFSISTMHDGSKNAFSRSLEKPRKKESDRKRYHKRIVIHISCISSPCHAPDLRLSSPSSDVFVRNKDINIF